MFYSINYNTLTSIGPDTYNINFTNGIVTITETNPNIITDKSYPILKDFSGNTIAPTAWYAFDTSTNIGLDSIGLYNMTNNGSVNVSLGVKGNFSASFNGTNQSLTTSSGVNLNSKSFSISFWSYLTKTFGDRYILNIGSVNGTRQFLTIGYKVAHTFSFCFFSDDLDTDKLYAYEDLNKWIHYTCTYNVINNQRIIYRNGLLVKVGNSGGSLNTTNILTLGYFSGFPAYYGGGVDDLRIY
ncbi:MAG: LamG domain-containing protein, partial [Alphaproteobacteria bacterium]|nr:LamG domain-containing protein [Alphaproteobacteria bacterium]